MGSKIGQVSRLPVGRKHEIVSLSLFQNSQFLHPDNSRIKSGADAGNFIKDPGFGFSRNNAQGTLEPILISRNGRQKKFILE